VLEPEDDVHRDYASDDYEFMDEHFFKGGVTMNRDLEHRLAREKQVEQTESLGRRHSKEATTNDDSSSFYWKNLNLQGSGLIFGEDLNSF